MFFLLVRPNVSLTVKGFACSPDAAVPICKFEVQIDGQTIQADLNTNERLGKPDIRLYSPERRAD